MNSIVRTSRSGTKPPTENLMYGKRKGVCSVMANQATFRQQVQRRKRILRWWERNCILIVALGILSLGFLIGWFTHSWVASQTNTEPPQPEPTLQPVVVTPVPTIIPLEEPTMEVYYYDVPLDEALQDHIRELCEENDVPMELVLAIISCESSYDPYAVSVSGDYGLMQINRINHEWLEEDYGITDILNPYQNITGGVTILAQYREMFDSWEETIVAYNRGPTGARNLFSQGITATEYSINVMARYEQLKEEAALEAGTSEGGR